MSDSPVTPPPVKFLVPSLGEEEIAYMVATLRQGHLATGVIAPEFEDAFTRYYGYPHVVSMNSGTSAMYLALLARGVGPGDEVLVTPYSIMATVNVILAVGATPVFVDVDRDTYNMDPRLVGVKVTSRTKVCLPASIFGVPCDVEGLRYALPTCVPILEDSIEALGSKRRGRYIGQDVEAAAFGFFPNKQATTCQGGVLVSQHKELIETVRRLTRHGFAAEGDLWMQAFGHNMRLADPLAAMGTVQLQRQKELQGKLRAVKALLDTRFRVYRQQQVSPGDDVLNCRGEWRSVLSALRWRRLGVPNRAFDPTQPEPGEFPWTIC